MDTETRERIEKQIATYKQQEEGHLFNFHRLQGARMALEALLKEPEPDEHANGTSEEPIPEKQEATA